MLESLDIGWISYLGGAYNAFLDVVLALFHITVIRIDCVVEEDYPSCVISGRYVAEQLRCHSDRNFHPTQSPTGLIFSQVICHATEA